MAFMEPEYEHATKAHPWYRVETTHRTELVPGDLVGNEPTLADFRDYVEGAPQSFEPVSGYFARLSAPGYLDATEWSGPFDTLEEAQADLRDTYDVDPETGDDLDA